MPKKSGGEGRWITVGGRRLFVTGSGNKMPGKKTKGERRAERAKKVKAYKQSISGFNSAIKSGNKKTALSNLKKSFQNSRGIGMPHFDRGMRMIGKYNKKFGTKIKYDLSTRRIG